MDAHDPQEYVWISGFRIWNALALSAEWQDNELFYWEEGPEVGEDSALGPGEWMALTRRTSWNR